MKTKEIIEVNQEGIEQQQAVIKKLIPYLQGIYDRFDHVDVVLHIEDFNTIVGCATLVGYEQTFDELVLKRMLEHAKYKSFSALPKYEINKHVKLPNLKADLEWISQNRKPEFGASPAYVNTTYLELMDGRVLKLKDADSIIKEKFTQRTIMPDYDAINKRPTGISKVIKNLFK
ncbi:hypothetical protein J3L18_10790 [Mucilaginibacter gossypii]|uniref:hypothetical protein n=1 Tax=Mucilaginibacter gossypii TaxID=551996 RepID=UPI000DCC0DAF|nr:MULTISPECIES: hypothetical protein [Mucilaginibacter]QTE39513.1 hypothetical protein J3L18_10790 [Mucilaginibacter gossypii]RAV56125.1 hypothetical protein DIU36_15330 [Mucilaginibacter rubeus]